MSAGQPESVDNRRERSWLLLSVRIVKEEAWKRRCPDHVLRDELAEVDGCAFMNLPLLTYGAEISPRPVLLIAGDKAHSRYFSEDAYKAAAQLKELMIINDANHVDLYDRLDKIPFDKISEFFGKNLR